MAGFIQRLMDGDGSAHSMAINTDLGACEALEVFWRDSLEGKTCQVQQLGVRHPEAVESGQLCCGSELGWKHSEEAMIVVSAGKHSEETMILASACYGCR